jgi:hypothetical protein
MIVPFSETTIDRKDIDQSLLDIDQRSRTSLFTWNGQFSPQFIEALLARYADKESVLYDPFAGSGTVMTEGARRNLSAFGVELNPAAYYMAKCSEYCALSDSEVDAILNSVNVGLNEALQYEDTEKALSSWYAKLPEGRAKDTAALLIVLCDFYKNEATPLLISAKWAALTNLIKELPHTQGSINVYNADSRESPIASGAANLVITSPPYINVMNYHQQYRRSVEALGFDVLAIAKSELGSNRRNRGNRFLTVIEYSIDMALSLIETCRVVSQDARMIFVVGKESTILGSTFCNSEIVYRAACEIAGVEFMMRQQRVFKNRYGKMIYEDILHFRNEKHDNIPSETAAIAAARQIAVDVITSARDFRSTEGDRDVKKIELLNQAIEKAESVGKA